MRIITEGRPNMKVKPKQEECPYCGCGFEYMPSDLIPSYGGSIMAIQCPWCEKQHVVSIDGVEVRKEEEA